MEQTEDYVRVNHVVNQVHLMRRLIAALLEDAKSATEHISTFNGQLNQLHDVGFLQIFHDKMKAIFLLMSLPEPWEPLVVSLSNSPSLRFGVF